VLCRIPLQRLVADLLAVSLTSPQQDCNKLAASLSTGKLREKVCNGFWAFASLWVCFLIRCASWAWPTITDNRVRPIELSPTAVIIRRSVTRIYFFGRDYSNDSHSTSLFRSGIGLISLLILFLLPFFWLGATSLKTCRFKSDLGEICHECSSSTNGVEFPIWRHNFKMATMTSFHAGKCCRLVSKHEASASAYAAAPTTLWSVV